ncbi:hypothetical protein ACUOA8_34800, partial [Escherichia sp. SS-MK2]
NVIRDITPSAMILLLTNAFDLGKWITNHVPASALKIPDSIKENIVGSIEEGDVGSAMSMWFVSGIALVITFVMSGIIYLVAWSRIVTIMLYISVAPLPFASVCVLVNVTTRIAIETIISINPYKPVPSVVIKLFAFSSSPAYTTRQTNMKYP